MNCEETREALLDAELPFTDSECDAPLADHLRGCANCSAIAVALENQLAALGADYAGLRPGRSSADATATAILDGGKPQALHPTPAADALSRSPFSLTRNRRGVLITAFMGVAIAAALTVFVLNRNATDRSGRIEPQPSAERSPIQVQVPANQNAIVFETRNPNITVVWLYSGD